MRISRSLTGFLKPSVIFFKRLSSCSSFLRSCEYITNASCLKVCAFYLFSLDFDVKMPPTWL